MRSGNSSTGLTQSRLSRQRAREKTRPVSTDTASISNNTLFTEADRQDIQSLQEVTKKTQSDIASIQSDLRSLISAVDLHPAPQARQPEDQALPDAGLPDAQTGASL